jgi:hypothetical protein
MDWYPLRLTTPIRSHVFGGMLISKPVAHPKPGPRMPNRSRFPAAAHL